MRLSPIFLLSCFVVVFLAEKASTAKGGVGVNDDDNNNNNGKAVYIVYMGAADSTNGSLKNEHAQLLNSVLQRNQNAVVRNYKYGFSGFAARLTKEEADSIVESPGVVSVFPDPILKLHTTRSWDFLKFETDIKIDSDRVPHSNSSSFDTIIGIMDSGIWPEAQSFNDEGMGPIPSRWKGTCIDGYMFNSSSCNKKIIGARYYNANTPRDWEGHGTHVASTAAGRIVTNASYYGLAAGIAKGGSPGARVAAYKVCTYEEGCPGSAILSAFDDAIADGVDVLSLSIGSPSDYRSGLTEDPIAIGAFHAVEHGILVVCSAGNDGPTSNTVANDAPWVLTVAATTIDRGFQSDVVLGGGSTVILKGEAINFSPLSKSPMYPLIYGGSARAEGVDLNEARKCHPMSLDKGKIKGKIVLCDGTNDVYAMYSKLQEVIGRGEGIGLIHIDDQDIYGPLNYVAVPATVISSKDGNTVLQYINSTSNPVATILPTVQMNNYKPAPVVAGFSSRGPSTFSRNILKPDIAAPGVDILAAWTRGDTFLAPKGKDPPLFNIISGTSMACPHVSGIAASIKSRNPTWSPSTIRSAIMTTATRKNNMKDVITTHSGSVATPYDLGAGEVTTLGSQPGLIYETSTNDYLDYLCYIGVNLTAIRVISKTVPNEFACPKDSSSDHVSNINYPSIAISNLNGKMIKNVSRTVTNVSGDDETIYSLVLEAPKEVNVKVIPDKLQFTKASNKLSYQVIFSLTSTPLKEDVFGSITWTNGKYTVRSPFVISSSKQQRF